MINVTQDTFRDYCIDCMKSSIVTAPTRKQNNMSIAYDLFLNISRRVVMCRVICSHKS